MSIGLNLPQFLTTLGTTMIDATKTATPNSGDEFTQPQTPKLINVIGEISDEMRTLWDDTSTEVKVGVTAIAAFGLGMYVGTRAR